MHPRDHVHSASMSSGATNLAPWSRYDTGQLFKIIGDVIRELSKRFIKGEGKATIRVYDLARYPYKDYMYIVKELEAFEMVGLHLIGDTDWKKYLNDLPRVFELLKKNISWRDKMDYPSFQKAVNRFLHAKGEQAENNRVYIQYMANDLKTQLEKYDVIS